MRTLLSSVALLVATTLPAFADSVTGTVLAFDRVDLILVLDDKTVWDLPDTLELPADMKAGDVISIEYETNGDNGVAKYLSLTRAE